MERDRTRGGYAFSSETKKIARQRASGQCEFPPGCERPNNNKVGHLDGVAVARAWGLPTKIEFQGQVYPFDNPDNTIVQCDEHDLFLDNQQAELVRDIKEFRKATE